MRIALLIVDMQNQFMEKGRRSRFFETAVEHINYVADMLRRNDQMVVHVHDVENADPAAKEELEGIEDIVREERDITIHKEHSNAFWNTSLEKILKDALVDCVLVSGFAAEFCVLCTYQGALERGYTAAILQNGIIPEHEDGVDWVYRTRQIVSYSSVAYLLRSLEEKHNMP